MRIDFFSATSPPTYLWATLDDPEPVIFTITIEQRERSELERLFKRGRRGYWFYPETPRLLTRCAPPRALHTPLLRDYHRARRHARPSRCVRMDTMVGC